MFPALRLLLLLGLVGLQGCASLSKSECRSADWFDIGVRDGANGRAEEYVINHAASCEKLGIAPNRELWHDGRQRGLARYCTARNGYEVGAGGGSYSGVCMTHDEPGFLHGFDLGRDVYEMRARLAGIESDIHKHREALKVEDLEDRERKRLRLELIDLELRREVAQRDHDAAVWRARDSLQSS